MQALDEVCLLVCAAYLAPSSACFVLPGVAISLPGDQPADFDVQLLPSAALMLNLFNTPTSITLYLFKGDELSFDVRRKQGSRVVLVQGSGMAGPA
jgi:hypothetical protein